MRKYRRWSFLVLSVLILLVLCILLISTEGAGKTIIVTEDEYGFDRHLGIRHAINTAEDGDTLRVYEGMYRGGFNVNKSIHLIGNGSEVTKIFGSQNVVTITAENVTLSGFHISGSQNLDGGASFTRDSWGIVVEADNCSILNNNCSGNLDGIWVWGSQDTMIDNNIIDGNGEFGVSLQAVYQCIVRNNSCSLNGDTGIRLYNTNNCSIIGNTCSENEIGIDILWTGNCTIERNVLRNNDEEGISIYRALECSILDNLITQNAEGIHISYSLGNHTAHNNSIFDNTDYGMRVLFIANFSIFAQENWWGENNGPYHPTKNKGGDGDRVSDMVLFEPWLDENGELAYVEDTNTAPLVVLITILGLLFSILTYMIIVRKSPSHKESQ
jgi:parallel beta-helix repeat protein